MLNKIGVLVDQRLAHAGGMFGVHAKYDGLLEAIAAFLEEFGDFLRHQFGAVVNDQRAIEVFLVINAIFNLDAIPIKLAFFRAIALDVAIDVNLDDFVGREEAVLNALLEGVGINRLAEIVDV